MSRAEINLYEDMCLRFLESKLPKEVDAALAFENETEISMRMCRAISAESGEREKLGAVVLFTGRNGR
jgi:hypothetical protein